MKKTLLQQIGLATMLGLSLPLAAIAQTELSDGEIRKIDKDNKKLTIKHGDIKNLDMPGMTMVFQVKEPAMVEQVKVGDKIRFRAEKAASGFMVTELQPAAK
ncbi:copper-binding protein [Roseateles sp. DAIF2]|uniref:copper-binding protein n=1 Tax=Roseateles sp. DAIF2 TaxID=2714952 RepID=UPI0018A29216|nr:copper-binding protein [Roseateles sp. DAIF2]